MRTSDIKRGRGIIEERGGPEDGSESSSSSSRVHVSQFSTEEDWS